MTIDAPNCCQIRYCTGVLFVCFRQISPIFNKIKYIGVRGSFGDINMGHLQII